MFASNLLWPSPGGRPPAHTVVTQTFSCYEIWLGYLWTCVRWAPSMLCKLGEHYGKHTTYLFEVERNTTQMKSELAFKNIRVSLFVVEQISLSFQIKVFWGRYLPHHQMSLLIFHENNCFFFLLIIVIDFVSLPRCILRWT